MASSRPLHVDRLRKFAQVHSNCSHTITMVGGMSVIDALHGRHVGNSSYWIAILLVPVCLGVSGYLTRKILGAITVPPDTTRLTESGCASVDATPCFEAGSTRV